MCTLARFFVQQVVSVIVSQLVDIIPAIVVAPYLVIVTVVIGPNFDDILSVT